MRSVMADTIGGFNTFLEQQQKATTPDNPATWTLVQFDDVDPQEVVHDALAIGQVPPLTDATFQPRGNTPLLDALGKCIVRTGERLKALPEPMRPEKVIFVLITDGQENASHEYTRRQVFDMIEHQRAVYKWEFVYLGANQDAIQEAQQIGIPVAAAATYTASSRGTRAAYGIVGQTVNRMRQGGMNAFTPAERKSVVDDEDDTSA